MRIARRNLIGAGLAAFGAGLIGAKAQAAEALAGPVRSLSVLNLHTGEKIKATYWEAGGYVADAVSAVSKVLRDFRTGDVHAIDPGLLDMIAGLNTRLGGASPVQIVCGYRSPKTNAMLAARSGEVAKHSLHMEGKAADLRIEGVELRHLRAAALDMRRGGVGFYPASNFVHVDVGRQRSWSGT